MLNHAASQLASTGLESSLRVWQRRWPAEYLKVQWTYGEDTPGIGTHLM